MGGGPVSNLDTLDELATHVQNSATELDELDAYYAGHQPLAFLHPEVEKRAGDRIPKLAINWARVIVGAIEERLDIEGFRLGVDAEPDDRLWGIWQANDMDEWSQMVHIDALVHRRSFVSVWFSDDPETPRLAPESARQMTVAHAPGTRDVIAAAKVWRENEDGLEVPVRQPTPPRVKGKRQIDRAVLYLPDVIERYQRPAMGGRAVQSKTWILDGEPIPNPLGEVPVVPFVNRPRLTDLTGETELADVLTLVDAMNKLATDMMVSSEFHAIQRRWFTNMEIPKTGADRDRFVAEVRKLLQQEFPDKPTFAGKGVQTGVYPEAQLDNFINAIKLLASQIAAIAGLPPHYLGLNADNPASADAIRSAEASLVKKALRKQRGFGGSWERVMRLALRVADPDNLPDGVERMETIWRDPATPTPAQLADYIVKLTQPTAGGRPVITIRQAREDLRYTPQQIERMEADDAKITVGAPPQIEPANAG